MCLCARSRACAACLCLYVDLHRLHLSLRPSTHILFACIDIVYAGLASREQDAVAAMANASTLASRASRPRPRKPRSGAASGGKARAADKGDQ